MRDELESLRFEKDAAVQQAVQRSADEIQQLKMTSSELRAALESQKFEYEAKLQKQILDFLILYFDKIGLTSNPFYI